MTTDEIKNLISQMTFEEKAGELLQLPATFFESDSLTGPASELGITKDQVRTAGSCLSVAGAKKLRRLQKIHMEEHPHHIPMLFMADIINGYQTVFPIPLAQGCTFDAELTEECAAAAAREAAAAGIHVTFSPMADLVRDPRWGRVMEATGEDPCLNGRMAAAMVSGYQGRENCLTEKGRIAACLKHFAGYGAPAGGRDYNTVELSERSLREDYLPAYKAAVDAGCALVMTSFNTLDRIPSSANRRLMRDILRKEMKFDGVLISDWAAIAELIPHGVAADEKEAAKKAINAGVDIDMATSVYVNHLKELVEEGALEEDFIDEAVFRVLHLKNKLGLFENPYKDACEDDETALILCEEHKNLARTCAENSFVLLKNEGHFLPLNRETETIAFIGPYADSKLLNGSWSIFSDDEMCVTVKDGILNAYPDSHVSFAPGCPMVNPEDSVIGFHKTPPKEKLDSDEAAAKALEEALTLAKSADKVVLALGEHREFTGEAASRADITLPAVQLNLLDQICRVNPNVCVVLFNGRPLDLREVEKKAKAILEAWLPGTEGGNAVARVLFGDQAPSGRLSMSFPYCVGQVPVHYSHLNTGRPFSGDYRTTRFASKYQDIPNEPLYPFGYGLTYTTFSYSPVSLDQEKLSPGAAVTASVTLCNTGKQPGTETVQMYLRDVSASAARPVRELKDFKKVTLAPGEQTTVNFAITEEMLRFYDINMEYRSEPGGFEVYIGADSRTQNKAFFSLTI